jgi:hypothetical protein
MKTTFAILAATTALGALVTIPAIAANRSFGADNAPIVFSATAKATETGSLWLVSGDDDDGEDDDCEDDDEDEGDCSMVAPPSPAGTVAPPANGLFGTGAAPQVQVN